MLELFQMTWPQITQKMPEIAEAGYDSLWLPNPAKGDSGAYSIGYDQFDPFDLGSTNQQGTVATRYGTQAQLIQMVQTAHRFGIRVYFDNVMNHRATTVPGYAGSSTPTNYYPGLIPQDFHLQQVSGGYQNWDSVSDWCSVQNVENNPLLGLCDLANEPGTVNWNFGTNYGDTITKPVFIRFPNRPDLYMDTNSAFLGTGWGGNGWHGFNGNHGQPVPEDVSTYLCRAAAWTLYITKCDGFRLDAVKHVPVSFFGNESGQTDDPAFAGYTGAIQAMYDFVHGYGSNVVNNGYVETDGNRNSLFNTESPRNDAMIFGEYVPSALPQGDDYYDYLNSGMRLLNFPLYSQMNSVFSGASMSGMDGRDYIPPGGNCDANGNFSAAQAVNFPQTQDGGSCCPANEGMENSYFFMHEGLPMVYSDGFNHNVSGGTPIVSYANYLGEFGDNSMPDIMYLHNQLARGGTRSRWSDQNIVAFERYDYREVPNDSNQAFTNVNDTVVLFAMNDNMSFPGDEYFVDGINDVLPPQYAIPAGANGNMQGLAVGFPPGSVLYQLASSTPGDNRTFPSVAVRPATNNRSAAIAANGSIVYVGNQTIPTGGGAIEFMIPSGGWVMYGYQWPQASRANPSTNAIVFRQGGLEAPHITVYRTDGTNGDPNYNPIFPFKMRGSVDPYGNVIGGVNVSNLTYAIDVPIVTNATFDIIVRSDASCSNTLVKLDGGIDLNSQMGLGPTSVTGLAPTNFLDLRDNPPGYADDVFLGYEQSAFQFRDGPEKFAARNTLSNNIVSLGAETYYYSVAGTNSLVVPGSGYGASITDGTAAWVYHDPLAPTTVLTNSNLPTPPVTQMVPTNPAAGQPVNIYVKVGYQFQINACYVYYTTDGSNPEGAFGMGKGTTQVVRGTWVNHDSAQNNIDWWMATIPGLASGTQVRYKVALFNGGSYGFSIGDTTDWPSIQPISDADPQGAQYYGMTQAAITNFNPAAAIVWLHNDLNPANTITGLQSGFHIVRARVLAPRPGQSSVYNTFSQTFYYDAGLPQGVIAYPGYGNTISGSSYTVVVRADNSVSGVDYNIQDSYAGNDDDVTGEANGNGNSNGVPVFVSALPVTPDPNISAQYPNYPQEFRFNYVNVPASGSAVITVRLKTPATAAYTNRLTTLSTTVNTLGPLQYVEVSSPAADGSAVPLYPNTTYVIQTCFTSSLTTSDTSLFSLYINGVLQPTNAYVIQNSGCGYGLRTLYYGWSLNSPGTVAGTNVISVVYSNNVGNPFLSATRTVIVPPPLQISGLSDNNQLVVWASAPGLNYEVQATTNLSMPFTNISGVIPGNGSSTYYFDDTTTNSPQKFYRILAVP